MICRSLISVAALLLAATPVLADGSNLSLHHPTFEDPDFARGSLDASRRRSAPDRDIYPNHSALLSAITTGQVGGSARTVSQQGYTAPGDGGAADYDFAPNSAAAADGVFTITPGDNSGRFVLRIPGEGVHPEVAGAVGNGTANDSGPVNTIASALHTLGGGVIMPRIGHIYNLGSNTVLPEHVEVRCPGTPKGTSVDGVSAGSGFVHPANVVFGSAFSGSVKNCRIGRTGLAKAPASMEALYAAVAQWNGEATAVTYGGKTYPSTGFLVLGNDVQFVDNVVFGFHHAVYSEGFSRLTVRHLGVDDAYGVYVGGSHDTSMVDDIYANNLWGETFDGGSHAMVIGGALGSGGTGYTNGTQTITLTPTGVSCATLPKLTATVSGGVVTALASGDVGDCPVAAGAASYTLSGGGGSGLALTPTWVTASWRPGRGVDIDGTIGSLEGATVNNVRFEGFNTCIHIRNVFDVRVNDPVCEGDPLGFHTLGQRGLDVSDCIDQVEVNGLDAQSYDIDAWLHPLAGPSGGSCGAFIAPTFQSFALIGGHLGDSGTVSSLIDIGPNSRGSIIGTQVGGPGQIIINAGVLSWQLIGLQATGTYSFPSKIVLNSNTTVNIDLPGMLVRHDLPTSASGLPSGSIWNNSNVLNVAP